MITHQFYRFQVSLYSDGSYYNDAQRKSIYEGLEFEIRKFNICTMLDSITKAELLSSASLS